MEKLIKTLSKIQKELKAPKGQYNSFGKYKYRSCEDILESVKPLLGDNVLTLSDEIILIGDRYYIKATAKFTDGINIIENIAFAREEQEKKGMDGSQITGTSSSYARKYALNGLFCIDDTKDADTDEFKHNQDKSPKSIELMTDEQLLQLTDLGVEIEKVATYLKTTADKITKEQAQKIINTKLKELKK